ncbi:DMT family transporter [Hypericibacter sp.]|uniref:DMT family transporter n=1 Tax=Hypericibacter sp. TaxID=2705401 RepID=UPI003D6C9A38
MNPDASKPTAKPIDYLLLLCLATLWGASYSLIKVGVETIPPITFIAGRTVIAGALLLAVMRMRGITMPRDLRTWARFLFQALMNSVLPFTLIAWAEQTIDAGLAAILNSMTPIFTFLLTWLLMRPETARFRKLIGVATGFAGVTLIVGVGALEGIGRDVVAELAVIAATICYAGAAIFGRTFSNLSPLAPAAGSLLCGAVVLVPVSLIVDRPWTLSPSTQSLEALVGLAVCSTALAFVIFFRLIRTLGSVGTTAQAYLRAPIGVAIGVVTLGEQLAWSSGLGLLLVLAGVAAMTTQRLPSIRSMLTRRPTETAPAKQ